MKPVTYAPLADCQAERATSVTIRTKDLPGQPSFEAKIATQSGKIFLVFAIHPSGDKRFQNNDRFGVECDGSFVDLYDISTSGKRVLASSLLRTCDESCGGAEEYIAS